MKASKPAPAKMLEPLGVAQFEHVFPRRLKRAIFQHSRPAQAALSKQCETERSFARFIPRAQAERCAKVLLSHVTQTSRSSNPVQCRDLQGRIGLPGMASAKWTAVNAEKASRSFQKQMVKSDRIH